MKKIHILESKFDILCETDDYMLYDKSNFQAGTDFPSFYDEKTDTWYEATWNGQYAFPFGYWETYSKGYVFSIGDAWTTHENACGKVAKMYVEECVSETLGEEAYEFVSALEELVDDFKKYGYIYNEESDLYVSNDGSDEIDLQDWVYEHDNSLPYDTLLQYVENAVQNGVIPTEEEFCEVGIEKTLNYCDFSNKDSIEVALADYCGTSFQSYFENGYGMGRIWPEEGLITFYTSEQPDPDSLRNILADLANSEEITDTYNDLLDYFIIFEDYDNDSVVTGCTVSDYMYGNYGPDDVEDDEEDVERERTYGDGNTKFIPHLASAEEKQKMGIYKDFQASRDSKWAPRLKGFNNNMAAYRAARYPYSDSKIIKGNVISEGGYNKTVHMKKRVRVEDPKTFPLLPCTDNTIYRWKRDENGERYLKVNCENGDRAYIGDYICLGYDKKWYIQKCR